MALVMVVDDDPEIRQLLQSVMERAGHEVLSAADAPQAWVLLDRGPNVILIDIDMPGETGAEFVLRLRGHPLHGDVPVAFVTAFRDRLKPLEAAGLSDLAIIDKPFRIEQVQTLVSDMLNA